MASRRAALRSTQWDFILRENSNIGCKIWLSSKLGYSENNYSGIRWDGEGRGIKEFLSQLEFLAVVLLSEGQHCTPPASTLFIKPPLVLKLTERVWLESEIWKVSFLDSPSRPEFLFSTLYFQHNCWNNLDVFLLYIPTNLFFLSLSFSLSLFYKRQIRISTQYSLWNCKPNKPFMICTSSRRIFR